MKHLYFLILICLGYSVLNAQIFFGGETFSGDEDIELTLTLDVDRSTATIIISGPSNRWFGVAFGTNTMLTTNGYVLICNAEGGDPVSEYLIQGRRAPDLQANQNLQVAQVEVGGRITYTISRSMNTGDSLDYVFQPNANDILVAYAVGSGQNLAQHSSTNRGGGTLSLTEDLDVEEFGLENLEIDIINRALTILNLNEPTTFEVIDTKGAQVGVFRSDKRFDISSLKSGVYLLKHKTFSRAFLVQ